MGSSASKPAPLASTFQRMAEWDVKTAKRLLADYKEKDLDFGLDAQGLAEVVSGDKAWAEAIIDAFGGTNGIINALAYICGAILISSGAALEKAGLVFDALDFDATEQISMDEMTIAFLCCARGYCVMSATGKTPSDEELENVTLQAYRELSKSAGQSITKMEFTRWVIKYIASAPSCAANTEVCLDDMALQFGLVLPDTPSAIKSITEDVLSEMAMENNASFVKEPTNTEEAAEEAAESSIVAADIETITTTEADKAVEPDANDPRYAQQDADAPHDEPYEALREVERVAQAVDATVDNGTEEEAAVLEKQVQYEDADAYTEEFQQETPRAEPEIPLTEGHPSIEPTGEPLAAGRVDDEPLPIEPVDEPDAVDVQTTVDTIEEPSQLAAEDPPQPQEAPLLATEDLPQDGNEPVDLNAYDTYDYTQAKFDGSSGLPPPDPYEDAISPRAAAPVDDIADEATVGDAETLEAASEIAAPVEE